MSYIPKTYDELRNELTIEFNLKFENNYNNAIGTVNNAIFESILSVMLSNEQAKASLVNSINPNIASGKELDAICSNTGIYRKESTSSEVTCVITGTPGTIIPENSKILNNDNKQFYNPKRIVIPSNRTISALFISVEKGVINCDASTINVIETYIDGWDSVNNPDNGLAGREEESDIELLIRRRAMLTSYGSSSILSINGALSNISKVVYSIAIENYSSVIKTIYGIDIQPHSTYVSILADEDSYEDIASVLFNKSGSARLQGDYIYEYTPDINKPFIKYEAKWNNIEIVQLAVSITVTDKLNYSPDISDKLKNDIIATFNGTNEKTKNIKKYNITDNVSSAIFITTAVALGVTTVESCAVGIVGSNLVPQISLPANKAFELRKENIEVILI